MKLIILVLAVLVTCAGCSDDAGARRTLEAQGLRNIEITRYRWFGCGEHDRVHTGFTAIGPTGRPVSGIVCSGLSPIGKNYTTRFD